MDSDDVNSVSSVDMGMDEDGSSVDFGEGMQCFATRQRPCCFIERSVRPWRVARTTLDSELTRGLKLTHSQLTPMSR